MDVSPLPKERDPITYETDRNMRETQMEGVTSEDEGNVASVFTETPRSNHPQVIKQILFQGEDDDTG